MPLSTLHELGFVVETEAKLRWKNKPILAFAEVSRLQTMLRSLFVCSQPVLLECTSQSLQVSSVTQRLSRLHQPMYFAHRCFWRLSFLHLRRVSLDGSKKTCISV